MSIEWSGDITNYVIGALIALALLHVVKSTVVSVVYAYDDWRVKREVKQWVDDARKKRESSAASKGGL